MVSLKAECTFNCSFASSMQFCEIKYNTYSKWASLKSTSGCLEICLYKKAAITLLSMFDKDLQMYAIHTKILVPLVLNSYPKKYSKNLLPFGLLKKISKPNWNCMDIILAPRVCLHVTFFSLCPLLPPLLFSIVPIVMVWITNRMGDGPFLFIILMIIKRITGTG